MADTTREQIARLIDPIAFDEKHMQPAYDSGFKGKRIAAEMLADRLLPFVEAQRDEAAAEQREADAQIAEKWSGADYGDEPTIADRIRAAGLAVLIRAARVAPSESSASEVKNDAADVPSEALSETSASSAFRGYCTVHQEVEVDPCVPADDKNPAPEIYAGCDEWCNHCALCGVGILYGARCPDHYGVYPGRSPATEKPLDPYVNSHGTRRAEKPDWNEESLQCCQFRYAPAAPTEGPTQ